MRCQIRLSKPLPKALLERGLNLLGYRCKPDHDAVLQQEKHHHGTSTALYATKSLNTPQYKLRTLNYKPVFTTPATSQLH